MDFLVPKYRRDPNAKIESLYCGVANGGKTVTRLVKPALDCNHLEATCEYGPGLKRGEGGRIGILVLGGMETTLDEMEYLVEAKKQKPFVPRRSGGEIAQMCHLLIERRNDMIRHLRKNPSEAPKKKRTVRLHLPVGYRMMPTSEPGLKVLARI